MAEFWIREVDGRAFGPYSKADIVGVVKSGLLRPDMEISSDQKSWRLAGGVRGLFDRRPSGSDDSTRTEPAKHSARSASVDHVAEPVAAVPQPGHSATPRTEFSQPPAPPPPPIDSRPGPKVGERKVATQPWEGIRDLITRQTERGAIVALIGGQVAYLLSVVVNSSSAAVKAGEILGGLSVMAFMIALVKIEYRYRTFVAAGILLMLTGWLVWYTFDTIDVLLASYSGDLVKFGLPMQLLDLVFCVAVSVGCLVGTVNRWFPRHGSANGRLDSGRSAPLEALEGHDRLVSISIPTWLATALALFIASMSILVLAAPNEESVEDDAERSTARSQAEASVPYSDSDLAFLDSIVLFRPGIQDSDDITPAEFASLVASSTMADGRSPTVRGWSRTNDGYSLSIVGVKPYNVEFVWDGGNTTLMKPIEIDGRQIPALTYMVTLMGSVQR